MEIPGGVCGHAAPSSFLGTQYPAGEAFRKPVATNSVQAGRTVSSSKLHKRLRLIHFQVVLGGRRMAWCHPSFRPAFWRDSVLMGAWD